MKTYLHVELLQFFLLARSSQLYERCNPVNKFNGSPGGTEMIHTESPGNFVVIFEILPTDKKWKSNEITHCRSRASCGFNDRTAALQVGFFSHIDYTRTRTLQLCFVSPNKIRIQLLFHIYSVLDYFYLLLTRFSSEVDVVRRNCPSQVLSSPLLARFSIEWLPFLM